MVFSDLFFLFGFIPAFALVYLFGTLIDMQLPHAPGVPASFKARNLALALFSLIFYAWGEPVYVFLMVCTVLVNYVMGLAIDRGSWRRFWLILGIIADLGILGVFKYLGFFGEILKNIGMEVDVPNILLPIGVSFYIFQSVSYLVDVYRKEAPVQKNFLDLLVYISMFPQLIAGPIVRYGTVAKEINDRKVTSEDFSQGIFRFLIGLAKKVIIANQLSVVADQFLAGDMGDLTTTGAWLGILAFTFQIYFDFSGYSDMAIGLGRCIGFHFNENFDHPYCCTSITDFWRRWHISLGSFFRDYVYIPLGGNRKRQAINILSVWFLTGMWHGASWNFIIWGVYFGIIVMLEKHTILKIKSRGAKWALRIYALLLVVVGWGIFYFDDFDRMGKFFRVFSGLEGERHNFLTESAVFDHFWLWVLAIALCMPLRKSIDRVARSIFKPHKSSAGSMVFQLSRIIISLVILIVSVALLVGATNNAFIYTRF